jgi:hypothetical protein
MKTMLGGARWVHVMLPTGGVPVAVATSTVTSTDHRPSQATGTTEAPTRAPLSAIVGMPAMQARGARRVAMVARTRPTTIDPRRRSPERLGPARREEARVSTSTTELDPKPRAEVVWLHLGALH